MTPSYFQQHCPICGRTLRIESRLVGTNVVCQHCGGNFSAKVQKVRYRCDTILPVGRQTKIEALLLQGSRVIHSGKASKC